MNAAGTAPGITPPDLSTSSTSALPQLSQEWTTSRDLIAKLDERIHDTRKLVFGLFSALLTAGSLLGLRDNSAGLQGSANIPWLAVHLALLGLLLTGRFIERQALQLQAAVASRAWVLEMLTPVELTGTLSHFAPDISRETKLIYLALGGVSAFVTTIAVASPELVERDLLILGSTLLLFIIVIWWALRLVRESPWLDNTLSSWRSAREKRFLPLFFIFGSFFLYVVVVMFVLVHNPQPGSWAWVKTHQAFPILGSTLVYALIVFCLEPLDLAFARDFKDWSFSTTSCRVNETVSIVLMNQRNKAIQISNPVATLIQVFDEAGKPTQLFNKDQRPIQLFAKQGGEQSNQAKKSKPIGLRHEGKIIQVFNEAKQPIQDAIFDLEVPNALLVDKAGWAIEVPLTPVDTIPKSFLPKRRGCRWIWTPTKPGLWGLFLQAHPLPDQKHWFSRRFIYVAPPGGH